MTTLASEAGTVQFPLVRHAEAAGWTTVSETVALGKRRGEEGLFFYDELEAALLCLNPGIVTPADMPCVLQKLMTPEVRVLDLEVDTRKIVEVAGEPI